MVFLYNAFGKWEPQSPPSLFGSETWAEYIFEVTRCDAFACVCDFDDDVVIETAKKWVSVDDDPFAMLAGLTKLAQDEDTRLHLLGYKNKQEYEVMQHWINTRIRHHAEEMSNYE